MGEVGLHCTLVLPTNYNYVFYVEDMDTTTSIEGNKNHSSHILLRLSSFVKTEPPTFCFQLSIVLIAITMATLGLYVNAKNVLPDLDAMKVCESIFL